MTRDYKPVPRRYTNRAFPDYRFVPGRTPHPTRDPDGHSYHATPESLPSFEADRWSDCELYLFGIDLFNHEYWWEAHEALEAVWIAAGRHSQTGQFVQGLIQIAVALLKAHQGFTDVAIRMASEGIDRMKPVRGTFMGIDTEKLRADVQTLTQNPEHTTIRIELSIE